MLRVFAPVLAARHLAWGLGLLPLQGSHVVVAGLLLGFAGLAAVGELVHLDDAPPLALNNGLGALLEQEDGAASLVYRSVS